MITWEFSGMFTYKVFRSMPFVSDAMQTGRYVILEMCEQSLHYNAVIIITYNNNYDNYKYNNWEEHASCDSST